MMMQWKRKDLDLGRNQHDMMCERVNDVRGCRDDGMLEEGVEMWPILQYKNHYNSSPLRMQAVVKHSIRKGKELGINLNIVDR